MRGGIATISSSRLSEGVQLDLARVRQLVVDNVRSEERRNGASKGVTGDLNRVSMQVRPSASDAYPDFVVGIHRSQVSEVILEAVDQKKF